MKKSVFSISPLSQCIHINVVINDGDIWQGVIDDQIDRTYSKAP